MLVCAVADLGRQGLDAPPPLGDSHPDYPKGTPLVLFYDLLLAD